MTAALGLLPRLNPASNSNSSNRDGREGEDARLWKRVRTLETNLGYSNLALDDLPLGPDLGAKHLLWRTNDDRSHHGHGQHRKRRVPRSGPTVKSQGPAAQKRAFEEENNKSVPSLSPLPYGEKSTPFAQPQQPFPQRTAVLHRTRPFDRLPAPAKKGDEHKNVQAGSPRSMAGAVAVVRGSLASFWGDGRFLPPCPDDSQRSPSGPTANGTEPELGQSSHLSVQHSMQTPFVPGGISSDASPDSVRSATTTNTTTISSARVEAATESANADDHEEGNFNVNKADASTRRTEFFTAAAAGSSTNCYSYDNSSVGHQQDFHPAMERREPVNSEVVGGVNEKTGGSNRPRKLRVRVPAVGPPGQKLRTIRAVYCRSLVSPNNPLTSNTVVARVKKGLQSGCEKRPKVLLVGSGTFNPVHKLHIRRFYLARNFLEAHKGVSVGSVCFSSTGVYVYEQD